MSVFWIGTCVFRNIYENEIKKKYIKIKKNKKQQQQQNEMRLSHHILEKCNIGLSNHNPLIQNERESIRNKDKKYILPAKIYWDFCSVVQ